jgi:hypothetical protein
LAAEDSASPRGNPGRLTGRFTGSGDAPPRLVLELSEPEARRLYLTLEPEIRLLIDPAPSAPAG